MDNNILKGNLFSLANVDAQKVLNSLEDDELELNPTDVEIGRKRKRLDDFTPQEKMVRRYVRHYFHDMLFEKRTSIKGCLQIQGRP